MTGRYQGRTPPLEITRRDWRPILAAVVVPFVLYSFLTIFVLTAAVGVPGEGRWIRLAQLATELGRGVIDQLGWVFGILITIQLGCLIALLGGQVVAPDRREEASLRSALSVFSALPVVALAPAITAASIAAVRVGELRGALLVIVPALIVTVALSVFIGTLDVADELTKLSFAEDDRTRAQKQLDRLKSLDGERPWVTLLIRSVFVVLAVFVAAFLLWAASDIPLWPSWVLGAWAVLLLVIIPVTNGVMLVVSAGLKPTLTADGVATAVVLIPAVLTMHGVVAATMFALAWQLGVSVLIPLAMFVLDVVRVLLEARDVRTNVKRNDFLHSGGKLSRAGTTLALAAATKGRDDAQKRIDELKGEIARRAEEAPAADGRRRNDKVSPEAVLPD